MDNVIEKYSAEEYIEHALPFLYALYPQAKRLPPEKTTALLSAIRPELTHFDDIKKAAAFFFVRPALTRDYYISKTKKLSPVQRAAFATTLREARAKLPSIDALVKAAQDYTLFSVVLQIILTGRATGPRVHDIMTLLPPKELRERLDAGIKLLG